MSRQEKPERLSDDGKARKSVMLTQLHAELASVHQRRRTRKVAGAVALVAMSAIAGLMWLKLKPLSNSLPEQMVMQETVDPPSEKSSSAIPVTPRIASQSDRPKDKKPTQDGEKDRTTVAFEIIDDDELLVLLAAVGRPSVIGTVNGRRTVISTVKRVSRSKGL